METPASAFIIVYALVNGWGNFTVTFPPLTPTFETQHECDQKLAEWYTTRSPPTIVLEGGACIELIKSDEIVRHQSVPDDDVEEDTPQEDQKSAQNPKARPLAS